MTSRLLQEEYAVLFHLTQPTAGVGDVAVGVSSIYSDDTWPGAAYVFYGPLAGFLDQEAATVVFEAPEGGDETGISLVGAEDFDGDGIRDFVVYDHGTSPWSTHFFTNYEDWTGTISLDDADSRLGAPPDGCPGTGPADWPGGR